MYKGVITKTLSSSSDDLTLLINPISNLNRVGKSIFLELEASNAENSIWEIYFNPTITLNGTSVTVQKLNEDLDVNNTILLFTAPIISKYGIPFRKFILPRVTKEFSTHAPTMQFYPGESMLLRRTSSNTGTITCTWTWQEISI